jgi:hypothetical protein
MRTFRLLFVLTLALSPAFAFAQAAPPPLPDWDSLTPAQRELLVAPMRERWNANPEERARMLARAQHWQAMPAAQRERARHGMQRWEGMPPHKRAEARALFHAMRGMDAQQRRDFMQAWRQKTPDARKAWLDANPAPMRKASPKP